MRLTDKEMITAVFLMINIMLVIPGGYLFHSVMRDISEIQDAATATDKRIDDLSVHIAENYVRRE